MGDKNCCPRSWDIGHKLGAASIFLKYEGEGGHKAADHCTAQCTHLDTRHLLGPGGMQARGNEGVLAMSGYSTLALDNGKLQTIHRFSQPRRRLLLGPSSGWKHLLALPHIRHY